MEICFYTLTGGISLFWGYLRGQKILTMLVKAHTFMKANQFMGPCANASPDSQIVPSLWFQNQKRNSYFTIGESIEVPYAHQNVDVLISAEACTYRDAFVQMLSGSKVAPSTGQVPFLCSQALKYNSFLMIGAYAKVVKTVMNRKLL